MQELTSNIPNEENEFGTQTLTIVNSEEYQLHIVDEKSKIEDDFFFNIYCKAFIEVNKILYGFTITE